MLEEVQTGGLVKFSYNGNDISKLESSQKEEIREGYEEYYRRRRNEMKRKRMLIVLLLIILIGGLLALFLKYK